MPLDGHSFLVAQGWGGKGTGLRQGAISKPITIAQKKSLAGLGKDRDEAFPFWDHLFSAAASAIKVKVDDSDDEGQSSDTENQDSKPNFKRTATGIICNRRPIEGTPAHGSSSSSGTNTPSSSSDPAAPRYSLIVTAKREAARKGLYSRFFRGPVLGPDTAFEKTIRESSPNPQYAVDETVSTSVKDMLKKASSMRLSTIDTLKESSKKLEMVDTGNEGADAERERKRIRKLEKEAKKKRKEEKERKKKEAADSERNNEKKNKKRKGKEVGVEEHTSSKRAASSKVKEKALEASPDTPPEKKRKRSKDSKAEEVSSNDAEAGSSETTTKKKDKEKKKSKTDTKSKDGDSKKRKKTKRKRSDVPDGEHPGHDDEPPPKKKKKRKHEGSL